MARNLGHREETHGNGERSTQPLATIVLGLLDNDEWEKMKNKAYDLEERLLIYSVRIKKIVEQLPRTRTGNHVAGQMLRAGTSAYPNHG
jgi:hypothetical protein